VIVVRAGAGAGAALTCGGQPLVPVGAERRQLEPLPGLDGGSELGKRYADDAGSVELLVTKAGVGSLGIGTVPLVIKGAKPLPSSD
jgi:hypothetical protein